MPLTGRSSAVVTRRAAELGLTAVQGAADKLAAFRTLLAQHNVSADETAYAGDDLPDLPVLAACGLAVALGDACPEARALAHYVTQPPGGRGAVREVIEWLLRAQGRSRRRSDRRARDSAVWTPKRVLILLSGMTLFLAGYFVYAYFLGGIDGLPVLPEIYVLTPGVAPDWFDPDGGNNEGETERKLKWAFGAESEEAKRPIKLDLRSRRLLLAAKEFTIVKEDGRVKLSLFSAALFGEQKGDGSFPEINIVQSEIAYLTLDQPVSNISELPQRARSSRLSSWAITA